MHSKLPWRCNPPGGSLFGFHDAHGLGVAIDATSRVPELPLNSPPIPNGAVLQNTRRVVFEIR